MKSRELASCLILFMSVTIIESLPDHHEEYGYENRLADRYMEPYEKGSHHYHGKNHGSTHREVRKPGKSHHGLNNHGGKTKIYRGHNKHVYKGSTYFEASYPKKNKYNRLHGHKEEHGSQETQGYKEPHGYKEEQDGYDGPSSYEYGYKAYDSRHRTNFGQKEHRSGHDTKGEYYVHLPDGRVQIVSYYVGGGNTGFVANVRYTGKANYENKGPGRRGKSFKKPHGQYTLKRRPPY